MEAEIEAARAQLIKTVASIPKASDKQTLRPAPPPTSEALVLSSGSVVTKGSNKLYISEERVSTLNFISDIVAAAAAITFAFLFFKETTWNETNKVYRVASGSWQV